MSKIFIGRIICFLTIFLMATGIAFSAQNCSFSTTKDSQTKSKGSIFELHKDINAFVFQELEEEEDFEDFDFCFESNSIFLKQIVVVLCQSHGQKTKSKIENLSIRLDYHVPIWLITRKLII